MIVSVFISLMGLGLVFLIASFALGVVAMAAAGGVLFLITGANLLISPLTDLGTATNTALAITCFMLTLFAIYEVIFD